MNKETFNNIIELNTNFYNIVAAEFDVTRQYPWRGWEKVAKMLNKHFIKRKISVLDVGCGNGRFYSYLQEKYNGEIYYVGVDNNQFLLRKAQELYPSQNFVNKDVIGNIFEINEKYDFVCAFGITHHIPSREYREKWFKKFLSLRKPNGMFCLTFWDIHTDKRFDPLNKNEINTKLKISPSELENGDYFISWGKKQNAFRYVHIYSTEELKDIKQYCSHKETIHEFSSDGKSNKLNKYIMG